MRKNYFLIFFSTLICFLWIGRDGYAQERTITGRVISMDENMGIPGVNVLIKGTQRGTVTDAEGNYSIEASTGETLVFSAVGYETTEIKVENQSVIDLEMPPNVKELSEIVVIGYGEREEKDLTGAISTVSSKDIETSDFMSPELAMQGRMTGVFVENTGGDPNARPNVRIRGVSTFNNAEPLIVIDGIPIYEFGRGIEGQQSRNRTLRGGINVMNLINPNDIASISVLKDASASAIYGVRAANGVILITTKKGQQGKARVEFNASRGIQNVPNTFDVLNVAQYTNLYQEAFANNPDEAGNLPPEFDPTSDVYLGDRPTTDWQTPLLNENAIVEDYTARLSGGNESTNYYISAGYSRQESVLINNLQERYSFSGNITGNFGNIFQAGATFRLGYVEDRDATDGNIQGMADAPPWQPILDPNGPRGYATSVDSTVDMTQTPFAVDYTRRWGPETSGNVFGQMTYEDPLEYVVRPLGTAYLQVEPLEGLKFKGTVSADWTYRKADSRSFNNFNFSITPGNPFRQDDPLAVGSIGLRSTQNFTLVKEFGINFTRSFGDHNIDVLLNASDQQFEFLNSSMGGSLRREESTILFEGVDREFRNAFSDRFEDALQGYMARVSYNYASKYYIDATVRRDGSSRFAPDYRWATFPSFAVAWRITSEPFMANIPFLDDLKMRAGWGQLGNQEVDPFQYISVVGQEPTYSYGSGNGDPSGIYGIGVRMLNLPNPTLTWEVATTTNVGFDAVVFNNLSFTAEYFHKITDDILQRGDLPASAGNEQQPWLNIASVRNSGFEFEGQYDGFIGDFQYSIGGNMTFVDNEVLDLYQDQPFGGTDGRIESGFPINYLWGWKVGGIFQSESEVQQYQDTFDDREANTPLVSPGDMYFQDVHGNPTENDPFYSQTPDSIVNLNDRTFIGSTIPGHYYGINLSGAYKGFDLSLFFQGIGDVQKINGARRQLEGMQSLGNNQLTTVLGRWTPENPSTTMPRAVRADPADNTRFSDRWVEDAGFMRLRNLQLGYTLPGNVMSTMGMTNARIYLSGTNVFTLTQWSGIDPENDQVPIPRIWSLGVNAAF